MLYSVPVHLIIPSQSSGCVSGEIIMGRISCLSWVDVEWKTVANRLSMDRQEDLDGKEEIYIHELERKDLTICQCPDIWMDG